MKNETTHTPIDVDELPWEIDEQGIVWSDDNVEVFNDTDLGQANAAFIVRAVNHYDGMKYALEKFVERFTKVSAFENVAEPFRAEVTLAKTVLADLAKAERGIK